ncbi:MAG: hypothetical protein IJS15_13265 [Victivallales bacterium]|nr:hypothetical protein [Victivallales bacterium]
MKRASAVLCVLAAVAFGANPLGMREYRQRFELEFQRAEEASAAKIVVQGLPASYKLAFSSRWDDTAAGHLRTHKVMLDHKVPGTFFLFHFFKPWETPAQQRQYCQELLQGGCSIGLHTYTHPLLTVTDSFEQFREYMYNRIQLESISQSPVNSQVLPFCNWWAPDEIVPKSIGQAFRAAGVISSPDIFWPSGDAPMGYPKGTLAISKPLTPGDRKPDLAKLEEQLAQILQNTNGIAQNPSLSMAMHSWHTEPEGLEALHQAYERVADNPEWWYCNQNEYGAYRYEALNASVKTAVDGKVVTVTVQRMVPYELGARVPLWFTVEGAAPKSAAGAILHDSKVELPHDERQVLPAVYGRMEKDGKSSDIPFATLRLEHTNVQAWAATLWTTDGKPVEKLAFIFRFPPAWERETIRVNVKDAVRTYTAKVTQANRREEFYFQYGRPYYAVQADFVRDGVRYRLWADLQENAQEGLPLRASEAARFYQVAKDADFAALSQPGADLAALGAVLMEKFSVPRTQASAPGVLCPPSADAKNWPKEAEACASVLEFSPKVAEPIVLRSGTLRKAQLWLNGKLVKPKEDEYTLAVIPGVNRIAIRTEKPAWQHILLDGEQKQLVDFLKP